MFSHRFKMDGAFGAVIFHNRRWHVQHFWNWRVESPHEIDVSGNALHLALYLCCLATTYIVRLNLSRAAKWRNCLFREKKKRGKAIPSVINRKAFAVFRWICCSCLHWISSSAWLLSPSPSELLAMQVYWPICDLLTFVITRLWFEIIIPSLNVFDKSLPWW